MEKESLHIGELVKTHLQENGIRTSWVAKQLNYHRNNLYKMFQKEWIDTNILMKLSILVNHDFFADISRYYQKTYGQRKSKSHKETTND